MKRSIGIIAAGTLLVSQLVIGTPNALALDGDTGQAADAAIIPGKVIVKYKQPDNSRARMRASAAYSSLDGGVVTIDIPNTADVLDKVEELNRDSAVEYAQPVYVYRTNETQTETISANVLVPASVMPPNDANFSAQWGHSVTDSVYAWREVAGTASLRAVKIAILDTGVDLSHPDLAASIVSGIDFVNNDFDPSDDNGHGTHVAGIAAAISDNGTGISGVAGGAAILPVKIADSAGRASSITVANGIRWAVNNGASVINLSMGRDRYQPDSSGRPVLTRDQLEEDAVKYAFDHQVLVVASSGNSSNHWIGGESFNLGNPVSDVTRNYGLTGFPAGIPGVVSVGAVDYAASGARTGRVEDDVKIADFSDVGFVSVTAPGVRIISTLNGGGYGNMSGTSMSAPYVAGMAALIKAADPTLTQQRLYDILTDSAVRLPDPNSGSYANGARPNVRDDYGSGLLNGKRAFTLPRLQLVSSMGADWNVSAAITVKDSRGSVTGSTYGDASLNLVKYSFSTASWSQVASQALPIAGGTGQITFPLNYGTYEIYADDGQSQEFIRSNLYTYKRIPDAPVADRTPGSVEWGSTVALSSPIPGSQIRYTTDGTDPKATSALYSGPIQLDKAGSMTVKAIVVASDTASTVRELSYAVGAAPVATGGETVPAPAAAPAPAPFFGGGGGGVFFPGPIPLPSPKPLTPNADEKTVTAEPSGEKRTNVKVSKQRIETAISQESGAVTVDATTESGSGGVNVILDAETRQSLEQSGRPVSIRTDRVRLEVPAAMLSSNGGNADWRLSVSPESAQALNTMLPAGTNVLAGYRFDMSSAGKEISVFSEPIRITFSIEPGLVNDPQKTGVYWLDESLGNWQYVGGRIQPDGSIAFLAHHFSRYAVMERSKSFADLEAHWAKRNIEIMAGRGMTDGISETGFDPQGTVTRAQFAALLARSLYLKDTGNDRRFTDVKPDAWYHEAVYQALQAGIISGVTESGFRPEEPVTREQMSIMMVKAWQVAKGGNQPPAAIGSSGFMDAGSISLWAREAVDQAKSAGLMDGLPDGTFRPLVSANRAEAIVVIERLLDKQNE